jgi:nickel-dependent lactate racemase
MRSRIPYGDTEIEFEVDKDRLMGTITPREVAPSIDPATEIEYALKNPVEAPALESLHLRGKTVAIAVDDSTRATPTNVLLQHILLSLERAGVKAHDVKIIVALGTHREMTDRELREKYGHEVVEKYHVVNHAFDQRSELEYVGKIANDVPVWINKEYLNADVRIGTGNIIPHCNAGWAGGAKILLPGLAGEETVGRMHVHSAMANPNALGMDQNHTRQLIEEFAKRVGLHFIVNTVLTRHGEITKVFAGHFIKAHREGVRFAKSIYAARASGLAEITLSSSYPADVDFWQGSKGLFSAELATKAGGAILLVSPCPEGLSRTHPQWIDYLQHTAGELREMCKAGLQKVEDLACLGIALDYATVREKHSLCIFTDGISHEDTERMGFQKFDRIEDAIQHLFIRYGSSSKLNIITHGGDTYPVLC